jgi:fatty-acyl-CoA synthase
MAPTHPAQRREALDALHAPWRARTLAQHLDLSAARWGSNPFVVTDNHTYTYDNMVEWSTRLAAGLVELGIAPGDHVGVIMANHPEFVTLKFAISRIGAVSVPINFLLKDRELAYVLKQSDVVALITMDHFRDNDYVGILDRILPNWERDGGGNTAPKLRQIVVFPDPAQRDIDTRTGNGNGTNEKKSSETVRQAEILKSRIWRTLSEVEALASDQSMVKLDELALDADPASNSDILYTSGTTGQSKGVLLTHNMVTTAGYAAAYGRGLTPGHRVVFSLPMYHVFGYIECLLAVMYVGGAVVPKLAFDAADLLSSIAKHQVHEIACVPTMTIALLAEARAKPYDLSTLTIVYSSGGAAAPSMVDEIREVFAPQEVVAGYGQTETTAAMTSNLPELGDDYLKYKNGTFRNAGIAGAADLGGVLAVYKVIDIATGAEVGPGQSGELVVRGPAVTAGYYNKPDETAAAFTADGWLHTGDLGVMDEENYVTLVGRLKETYRCGGEMVMPKEVENLLIEHPMVSQAHVVGIPHLRMGEVGCAIIVAEPTVFPTQHNAVGQELMELCKKELARFKVPAHVLFLSAEELPLTVTGRVQKFRLVELVQSRLTQPQ